MSFLIAAAAVTGGLLIARWFTRSRRGPEAAPEGGPKTPARNAGPESKPKSEADPLTDFPCHLGDVVIGRGGEEAWLAGALVFLERVPTAALFVAPDAGGDRALFARAKPSPSLAWLRPIPPEDLVVGSEPPSSLEHKGTRFSRLRRIPFRVERLGTGAPDVGDQAIVAEYASGIERLLVVAGAGPARAWSGYALEEGTYDVLPAGKATLDR